MVKYNEASERDFIILFWFLTVSDILVAALIGFLIMKVLGSWKKLRELKKEIMVRSFPREKTLKHEDISTKEARKNFDEVWEEAEKLERMAEGEIMMGKSEKKKSKEPEKGEVKVAEKLEEVRPKSPTNLIQKSDEPKFDHKEKGPITITTDKLMQHNVFVDEKKEEKLTIEKVTLNPIIDVYEVGNEILEPLKNDIVASTGSGTESSIMTASIRSVAKKY